MFWAPRAARRAHDHWTAVSVALVAVARRTSFVGIGDSYACHSLVAGLETRAFAARARTSHGIPPRDRRGRATSLTPGGAADTYVCPSHARLSGQGLAHLPLRRRSSTSWRPNLATCMDAAAQSRAHGAAARGKGPHFFFSRHFCPLIPRRCPQPRSLDRRLGHLLLARCPTDHSRGPLALALAASTISCSCGAPY